MRHLLPVRLSQGSAASRLIPVLAVATLVAACQDAERSLAPQVDGPQFSRSADEGLRGTIAFHSTRDGDFDIYIMNADGSRPTRLTNTPDNDIDPIWSPDGKRIAFNRFNSTFSTLEILVMNADGSGVTHIADNAFATAWSPDGNRIAFASNRNGGDEVFVMNADGSGVTQLTHNDFVRDFPTAWSPNGKQILFQSDRDGNTELYVMNVDGTRVTRLTNNPASDEGDHAGWSPDGKRIVFSSTRDGGDLDIFVMNADGTGTTQLTHNDFIADDDPVWSPDGERIAFHSTRAGGDEDIYVMNADGTGVIPLTSNSVLPDGSPVFDAVPVWTAAVAVPASCLPPPAGLRGWWPGDGNALDLIGVNHAHGLFNVYVMTQQGAQQTQLTDAPFYNARPNWSHHGRKITFTACRATDFSCEVYVMNADGSGQTKLTNDFSADYMSVWSPDDQRIAFVSERDGSPQIYVMNADGSDPTRLTQSGAVDQLPTWSPDGTRIAFQTNRDDNNEIYVMNADGSNPTNLTQSSAADEFPAWSPGGDKIAFRSDRDGNGEIYVTTVGGSRLTRLTNNTADEYYPAWSPTGNRIAFVSNRDGNYEIYVMASDGSAQQRVTNNLAFDADPAWAIPRDVNAAGVLAGQLLAFASDRTRFAPGKVKQGFSFDGVGDVVFAPGAGIDDLQQLTIDAWVKHDSLPPGRIGRYVTIGGEKAVLRYDGIDGPAQLHFYMRIDGQLQHIRVNNVLQVGVFHHVAGSYDGAIMRLYLDGLEVGSLAITGTVDPGFGVEFSSAIETLDGVLDEIDVFDRALTASEVRAIFEAGAAGKCKKASGT
jgi:Tol biopolymer transport system component